MNRREFIMTAAVATTVGLAGCSSDTDDSNDSNDNADSPDEDGETETALPAWSEWVPEDGMRNEGDSLFALDIETARQEFPEDVYADFDLTQFESGFGISQSDMTHFIGIQGETSRVTAILGSFDPQSILDHLDVSDEQVEESGDYSVVNGNIAIGEGAILNGEDYETFVDAKAGTTASIGTEEEDWTILLDAVGGATLSAMANGSLNEESSLPFDVHRAAVGVDAADDGGAVSTGHYLFETEDEAAATLDEHQQAIVDDVKGETEGTVERVEQQGRRIVVVFNADEFDI